MTKIYFLPTLSSSSQSSNFILGILQGATGISSSQQLINELKKRTKGNDTALFLRISDFEKGPADKMEKIIQLVFDKTIGSYRKFDHTVPKNIQPIRVGEILAWAGFTVDTQIVGILSSLYAEGFISDADLVAAPIPKLDADKIRSVCSTFYSEEERAKLTFTDRKAGEFEMLKKLSPFELAVRMAMKLEHLTDLLCVYDTHEKKDTFTQKLHIVEHLQFDCSFAYYFKDLCSSINQPAFRKLTHYYLELAEGAVKMVPTKIKAVAEVVEQEGL